ncbi:MAG: signal recognition particle-docking protein FtsY [Gordonia sp. (in: high G+C Gram-positive bacteria)]|uniref:signal recognition particle-docking protein FtsY n=1 Tax=Gordonia sp. (in: high G+C Gram-positive bacteria) TaxID=84139 RepID=UPI0039E4AC14
MNTGVIIGIVVGVIVLLALIIGVGIAMQRRNRISIAGKDAIETDGRRQVDKSGGYQADTGFSFSQGGTATKEPVAKEPATKAPATAPATEEPVAAEAETPVEEAVIGVDEAAAKAAGEASIREAATTPADDEIIPGLADAAQTETADTTPDEAVDTAPQVGVDEDAARAAGEALVREAESTPVIEEASAPALDEIAPTEGRLSRLRGRLSRSQGAIGTSMLGLLGAGDLDEDSWEEIEDTLVMADLGTGATTRVVDSLREQLAAGKVRSPEQARAALKSVLVEQLHPELDRSVRALPHADSPAVVLVVGVNGVGKTTTTGKLARVLVADGRRVLLGAADTFRAAAADQLQTWGERVDAETVRGAEGADPASVAFDAVTTGIDEGVDVVLIDTAGRLHTKTGLMDELGKVKRVVEKKAPVDEVLLVLDATVGQNGLNQAKVFAEVVDLTGVVLTKLDGTAKGGIVFRIQDELGVPVKLVGLGEGADDLAPFVPEAFVDALL